MLICIARVVIIMMSCIYLQAKGKKKKKYSSKGQYNIIYILKTTNIVTFRVASASDRTKVSDRNAMYVLSTSVKLLEDDVQNFTLNKESTKHAC